MSSTADWSRFVNEKLYLASLQLERLTAIQNDTNGLCSSDFLPKRAEYLSCFWASVLYVHSAFQGVLAELAEYHQRREQVDSLESLCRLIGADKQEVVRLNELATAKTSWLWHLLSLNAFYHSPSARVCFDPERADKQQASEQIDVLAAQAQPIREGIIATSSASETALNMGQIITPLKLDWHLTELTEELLQSVIRGLKEFNHEIRTYAMEW